ncbi:protein Hir1p [Trichomonascus vanleenenianus]|uniref:Hir2p n=1 Tax=Trichomonascus vanleenenianus TaxID=2268995 RepID=UPI003ECB4AF7
MHLLKPSWLVHADENRKFEIYSVSLSPDGERLASGGLDGKVRVWSTKAVYESISGDNGKVTGPKQLCSMSNHNGAVTVVRFSPNGNYLASGSDDRVVLIWERDDTRVPRKEFGHQGEADSEAWVARKRLIGHDNDVQDLAWSPDGSILVTVGLDSSIIIWSGTTFEKLKRLDIHASHVKGITFDPANKYFATASDDRTIKIVRYHRVSANDMTFSVEATISQPFEGSPLSTYFRRCSWSPDGNHIAAANATNGPVATVAIINRGTWDSEISLVGHDAPCETASFCTRVFTSQKDAAKKGEERDCIQVIATAAQDKTLAIWNTTNPRPLLVARNVADKAITDIVWTPDGSKLFASSLDGTILVVVFDEGELGWPLPKEEVEGQLTKFGGTRDAMLIPESVEQVELEEKIGKKEDESEKKLDMIMGGGDNTTTGFNKSSTNSPAPSATTTTTTNGANLASTNPATTISSASMSSATISSSTSATTKANGANTNATNTNGATTNNAKPQPLQIPKVTQKVTVTKEGKKRVAPQLISQSTIQPTQQLPRQVSHPEVNINVMEMSKPSYALPKGGVSSLIIGSKRKHDDEDGSKAEGTEAAKKKIEEVPEFMRPAVVSPATTVSQVRLGVPKVRTFFSTTPADSVLEVRNGSGEAEPSRVVVTKHGQVVFIDFLPRHGHLATGDAAVFWAVSTEDGVINVYSPAGRRLMPSIVLGTSLTFLESQGPYLLAVTATGMVNVWNIKERRALHQSVSLAPVLDNGFRYAESGLTKAPSVTQCAVTASGAVIVTLTSGQGFTYSADMLAWHRISEDWWTVGSQYWDTSTSTQVGGIVGLAERRTNQEIMSKGRGGYLQRMAKTRMLQEGYEGFETVVSIAHLENRLGAAVMLGSKHELRQFLVVYAKRLTEEGLVDRVDELCRELLGPTTTSVSGGAPEWDSKLCGIDKHDLLKTVIEAVGSMRQVQRVISQYARFMGLS